MGPRPGHRGHARGAAIAIGLSMALTLALTGCAARIAEENAARQRLARVEAHGAQPDLPMLRPDSPLETYLLYAVMNHPSVTAAYWEWRAAVEAITPARSLPDPQLTIEADIADLLMTFMPGLMFDFMTPGKRAAMGREAAAASEVAYSGYVQAVLRAAVEARKAWIDLVTVDEAVRLLGETLAALDQALAVSGAEYTTGRGMASLEDQVGLLNQVGKARADLEGQRHRRDRSRVQLKSALGLAPDAADPPWPQAALEPGGGGEWDRLTPWAEPPWPQAGVDPGLYPPEQDLWRRAEAANPELATMRAMVDMAIAGVEVARKAGTPDFALGVMADLRADPLMVRPSASVTLPVWRAKIAATVAAAEARREAARARLDAAQLEVAAMLAEAVHMAREAERMIAYIDDTALPNLKRSAATAAAGYQAGMGSAAMIPQARFMALGMRLERLEAVRMREQALADVSFLVAEIAPLGAPLPAAANH